MRSEHEVRRRLNDLSVGLEDYAYGQDRLIVAAFACALMWVVYQVPDPDLVYELGLCRDAEHSNA